MNIGLTAGGCIYKSKMLHQVFKQSISCLKISLPIVIFSDFKAIVNIFYINVDKYSSNTEAIKYLINQWMKILIFYGHCIQFIVIHI